MTQWIRIGIAAAALAALCTACTPSTNGASGMLPAAHQRTAQDSGGGLPPHP